MLELDGVRGLAILFILIWHFVGIPFPPAGMTQIHQWIPSFKGSLIIFRSGVDLFFVLSGFLIGGILIDQRHSDSYYRTFYVRRLFRIIPLYYALLLAFIVSIAVGRQGPLFDGPIPLASYATLTQNYFMAHLGTYGAVWLAATWSLAIEEQFYIGFPLIVRRSRITLPWLFLAGIVGAPLLRIWCYRHFHNDFAAYTWLPCRLDTLCWGALLAHLVRIPRAMGILRKCRRQIAAGFVLMVGFAVVLDASIARNVAYHMSLWGHTLLAILYAAFLLLVVLDAGKETTSFLRWRALCYLGEISYGVYLLQGIVLAAIFQTFSRSVALDSLPNAGLILLALVLTVVIAALSSLFFERPAVRLGRRLSY